MKNTEEERLLDVVTDKRFNFETHIIMLSEKVGNELFGLVRIMG